MIKNIIIIYYINVQYIFAITVIILWIDNWKSKNYSDCIYRYINTI